MMYQRAKNLMLGVEEFDAWMGITSSNKHWAWLIVLLVIGACTSYILFTIIKKVKKRVEGSDRQVAAHLLKIPAYRFSFLLNNKNWRLVFQAAFISLSVCSLGVLVAFNLWRYLIGATIIWTLIVGIALYILVQVSLVWGYRRFLK